MTEQEYYRIAHACDRVLRHPDATLEWIAMPWLHVLCQHPVIVSNYRHVVEELRSSSERGAALRTLGNVFSQARMSVHPFVAVARNVLRAVTYNRRERRGIHPRALFQFHKADVIIVSWLLNVDHLKKTDDFYFGDLQSRLASRGLTSLLVLRNQTSHPTRELFGRARREGPCGRLILPDLESLSEEVSFIRRSLRARRQLRQAKREASSWMDRRVAREACDQAVFGVTVANLRLHAQISSLCRRTRPAVVMTLHEGHAWERCVWHAARTASVPVLCVGYQHTTLWQHSHAIKRSLGAAKGCDPDLVLTVGDVTRQILEASQELRGVRVLTFGTHRRASSEALADAPRFAPTFLVVPEGHESECIYLFDFALECARRLPDARFIFRTHSILPFEKIAPKLSGYHPAPGNVEVSRDRPIEDDFARAAYLLYRGSSTVIYAVLAGLKPFYVVRPGEMNIDPLYGLTGWREQVSSVEDLIARYVSRQARVGADGADEWRRARAFCDSYVQPVRDDAVRAMLEVAPRLSGAVKDGVPRYSGAVGGGP